MCVVYLVVVAQNWCMSVMSDWCMSVCNWCMCDNFSWCRFVYNCIETVMIIGCIINGTH